MPDHTITLTDDQETALQYGFDNGGTTAQDLDAYATEWLGSVLDQYGSEIPEQKAELIKESYLADPDTAAALDAALAATPVKPVPVPLPPIHTGF